MSRNTPAGIAAAINTESFRLPMLVHIALASGSVITLTDWDVPLVVDLLGDGALTYSPNKMVGLSAFSEQLNAPIDDSELVIIIDDSSPNSPADSIFIADDIRRGHYDNAVVTRGYVVPTSLNAPWVYCKYDSGQAKIDGLKISLELMGPEKRLEQPVSVVLTSNCRLTYGSIGCGMQTTAPVWLATHAYALHTIVKRATGSGIYWFVVTDAGTSGGTQPTWPTTNGGTVADGGVIWTAFRARRLVGTVSVAGNRTAFTATGVSVVNDFWGEGDFTWLTGNNAGDGGKVRSDNGTGNLALKRPAFDNIQVGDTFELVTGCRKRLTEDCIGKHDNGNMSRTRTPRYGGFPFLAEENVTATANKG